MEKVLDRNAIQEGENVKVTETVEKTYTRNDLLNMKMGIQRQKDQVINQMKELKLRHEYLNQNELDVDNMIALLPNEEIPIIQ